MRKEQKSFLGEKTERRKILPLIIILSFTVANCQIYSSCLEKKFPWAIGGSADEYNTRLEGDGLGNLFMCGMSYSRSDFIQSQNVSQMSLYLQSITSTGYQRWGVFLDAIKVDNSVQSYDITWLYGCKVANDSSSLVVSGSVNFDYTFFAIVNTSTGNLTNFFTPNSPFNGGQTGLPLWVDSNQTFVSILNKYQSDSWVLFKFDARTNKVLWQNQIETATILPNINFLTVSNREYVTVAGQRNFSGALYLFNYTNGSLIMAGVNANIPTINKILIDEIRNESYIHAAANNSLNIISKMTSKALTFMAQADVRYQGSTSNYIIETQLCVPSTNENVFVRIFANLTNFTQSYKLSIVQSATSIFGSGLVYRNDLNSIFYSGWSKSILNLGALSNFQAFIHKINLYENITSSTFNQLYCTPRQNVTTSTDLSFTTRATNFTTFAAINVTQVLSTLITFSDNFGFTKSLDLKLNQSNTAQSCPTIFRWNENPFTDTFIGSQAKSQVLTQVSNIIYNATLLSSRGNLLSNGITYNVNSMTLTYQFPFQSSTPGNKRFMIEGCTFDNQQIAVQYNITALANTAPYYVSQPINYSMQYYQNLTIQLPMIVDEEMNSPIQSIIQVNSTVLSEKISPTSINSFMTFNNLTNSINVNPIWNNTRVGLYKFQVRLNEVSSVDVFRDYDFYLNISAPSEGDLIY